MKGRLRMRGRRAGTPLWTWDFPPLLWASPEIPQKGGAEWRCGGRNAARAAPPRTRGRRPPIGCNLAPIAAEGSSDEKPLALLTAEDRRRLAASCRIRSRLARC